MENREGSGVGILVMSIVTALLLIGGGSAWYVRSADRAWRPRRSTSEAKSNLKAMVTGARAFFQEKDRYSASLAEIGFEPERGNRYAYFADNTGTMERRTTTATVSAAPGDTAVGVDLFKHTGHVDITRGMLPRTFAGGVTLGVTGTCPECEITMACAGNIDDDPTLDIWTISTAARKGPAGENIAPGEPFCEQNDLTE